MVIADGGIIARFRIALKAAVMRATFVGVMGLRRC
jgi:hypothetical protein